VSDLAAMVVALPTVDLAPIAPFAAGGVAGFDHQADAVSMGDAGDTVPQLGEPVIGFVALLNELAGASSTQLAPAEAGRRQPQDPTRQDSDEDTDKAAIVATPIWLVESPLPPLAVLPDEPVSAQAPPNVAVEAVSLAADSVPAPAVSAAPERLPAATAPIEAEPVPMTNPEALPRIEPPPGIRLGEEPQNAAAGRMAPAFGLALEPRPESATPGRVEPAIARPVESSPRSEAPDQTIPAALEKKPPAAEQARNEPVAPDEPQVVEAGRAVARPQEKRPAAEGSQTGAWHRDIEPSVRMRNPEAAERIQALEREPRVSSEIPSHSSPLAAAPPRAADGVEMNGTPRTEPVPPPSEPAIVEPRRPEPATREISLRVEAEPGTGRARAPVAVHVVERAGRIEIRVRSADPQLSQWLGREVPALVDRLEAEGYRSEILSVPAESGTAATRQSLPIEPQAWMSPERESSHQGGAHPDSQQHRPRPHGNAPEDEAGPGEISAFRRLHDGFLG
jgi:hypothetical protein